MNLHNKRDTGGGGALDSSKFIIWTAPVSRESLQACQGPSHPTTRKAGQKGRQLEIGAQRYPIYEPLKILSFKFLFGLVASYLRVFAIVVNGMIGL